jgi:hypothetical protein
MSIRDQWAENLAYLFAILFGVWMVTLVVLLCLTATVVH